MNVLYTVQIDPPLCFFGQPQPVPSPMPWCFFCALIRAGLPMTANDPK